MPVHDQERPLARSALTARRGYALTRAWDVYEAVVADTLVDYAERPLSDADRLWVALHDGDDRADVAGLRVWLLGDDSLEALDAAMRDAGGPTAREILTSHPYPDVYAWSLRQMFPPLSQMPPGLRKRASSSSSGAPR